MSFRNKLNRRPKIVEHHVWNGGDYCGSIVWVVRWKPYFQDNKEE